MGLFGNNNELQFGTCGSNGKSPANQEKQRGEMLFYERGRGSCKGGVRWRKLKVGSTVTFHWLSYGRLPQTERALSKEESFLPPAETVK